MISQKDFIYERLKNLVDSFKSIKGNFFFDLNTETYYVQLSPKEDFNNSKGLMDSSADIVFDFISQYPNDSLVFFTEDSLVDVDDLQLIKGNIVHKNLSKDFVYLVKKSFENFELDLSKPRKEFISENTYALAA